jgi:hypothetical protein
MRIFLLKLDFVADFCSLPSDEGEGDEEKWSSRFFYNSSVGTCLRFRYKGEGGNGNNFKNQFECHKACEQ